MTIMQLEAETLGLGSCWIQIRNRMAQGEEQTSNDFVKELLHIPEQYEVLAILALGVPDEENRGECWKSYSTVKFITKSFRGERLWHLLKKNGGKIQNGLKFFWRAV